jgi:hypothetical protein
MRFYTKLQKASCSIALHYRNGLRQDQTFAGDHLLDPTLRSCPNAVDHCVGDAPRWRGRGLPASGAALAPRDTTHPAPLPVSVPF